MLNFIDKTYDHFNSPWDNMYVNVQNNKLIDRKNIPKMEKINRQRTDFKYTVAWATNKLVDESRLWMRLVWMSTTNLKN